MFEVERLSSSRVIGSEKLAVGLIGATAAVCIASPFVFKSDRTLTGLLLGAGTVGSALFSIAAKVVEDKEPLYKSLQEADNKALKQDLQGEAVFNHIVTDIEAKRRIAAHVNTLPVGERVRFMNEYGLHGLVVLPAPPQPQDTTPNWLNIQQTQVETVAPKPPATPTMDWIFKLVQDMAELDPEKRRNHHIVINGPTQYGKSTLCSCIILLLSRALRAKGVEMKINLIDPKYPLSKWFVEPSFKGYEQVLEGVTATREEIEERKRTMTSARKSGRSLPQLPYYVSVTDEWDNIWGGGKGYGDTITQKQAEQIRNAELSVFKEGAALNAVNIVMGQSPLRDDHGFSQSSLNSATRIVLGIEAVKWVKSSQFPFEEMKEELSAQITYWANRGERVALVVPNNQLPFVAPVPREVKLVVDNAESTANKAQQPQTKSNKDWYEEIRVWAKELGRTPTAAELKAEWERLTGYQLTDRGVQLLQEYLTGAQDTGI